MQSEPEEGEESEHRSGPRLGSPAQKEQGGRAQERGRGWGQEGTSGGGHNLIGTSVMIFMGFHVLFA